MPKLIISQEYCTTDKIFFPQPAVLNGIISPNLTCCKVLPLVFLWATVFSISYSWLSPITIESAFPFWVPLGRHGCNKLMWEVLCAPLTFPVSYNLYATSPTLYIIKKGPIKHYYNSEEPGSLNYLVGSKTLFPMWKSTSLWFLF